MKEEEKLFELKGVASFYARDLDDALTKLSRHFKDLARGGSGDEINFQQPTDISLEVKIIN